MREIKKPIRNYRFSSVVMLAFSALSIPILAIVLSVTYVKDTRSMREVLAYNVERAKVDTSRMMTEFFGEAAGVVQSLADVAAINPEYFRKAESSAVLRSSLVAVNQLDSVYVTFEDGFICGVTRIDELRRTTQPNIPTDAVWQAYTTPAGSDKTTRPRSQIFFDKAFLPIVSLEKPAPYDPREGAAYIGAKNTQRVFIAEPSLNRGTGGTIISMAAPILREGHFLGAVSAHFTVSEIAHFLATNRITPHSMSIIVDEKGSIVVPPVTANIMDSPAESARLTDLMATIEGHVQEALTPHSHTQDVQGDFSAVIQGVASQVSFFSVDNSIGLPWKMLVISPEDDFIGPLRTTNQLILGMLCLVIPLELLLLYQLSRRISRGIELVSEDVHLIRNMNFESSPSERLPRWLREIAQLCDGMSLLRNALHSFSQYIPTGVVRQLVESGKPLSLGVEQKKLTILFADLENFSTFAQGSAPDVLLAQLSEFFSLATRAIREELGTVDKFIGDAVMAFWGAPTPVPNHPLRACRAALKISRYLEEMNRVWAQEGKPPLRIRIGIHLSEVLVGNIGSDERLSYTVIGDGVNVASRLEGVNKQFGTTICMSDSVYAEVSEQVIAQPLGSVTVKGRTGAFMVYQLLDTTHLSERAHAADVEPVAPPHS